MRSRRQRETARERPRQRGPGASTQSSSSIVVRSRSARGGRGGPVAGGCVAPAVAAIATGHGSMATGHSAMAGSSGAHSLSSASSTPRLQCSQSSQPAERWLGVAGAGASSRAAQQAQVRGAGFGALAVASAAPHERASLTWPLQHGRLQTTAQRCMPRPTISSTTPAMTCIRRLGSVGGSGDMRLARGSHRPIGSQAGVCIWLFPPSKVTHVQRVDGAPSASRRS
jgi:hypothetical protein